MHSADCELCECGTIGALALLRLITCSRLRPERGSELRPQRALCQALLTEPCARNTTRLNAVNGHRACTNDCHHAPTNIATHVSTNTNTNEGNPPTALRPREDGAARVPAFDEDTEESWAWRPLRLRTRADFHPKFFDVLVNRGTRAARALVRTRPVLAHAVCSRKTKYLGDW